MLSPGTRAMLLRLLLSVSGFLFSVFSPAQDFSVPFGRQIIEIRFISERTLEVYQRLIPRQNLHSGDTLYFYNYLNAYSSIQSRLGKALTDKYKLEFHFSRQKERAAFEFYHDNAFKIIDSLDRLAVILQKEYTSNDTLKLRYRLVLPLAKFTGVGYNKKQGTYYLKDWLLQSAVKTRWYPHVNLDDRIIYPIHTQMIIRHFPGDLHWNSNAVIIKKDDYLKLESSDNNIILAGTKDPWIQIKTADTRWVIERGIFKENEWQLSLILDKIQHYLDSINFPVAAQILITHYDLKNNPVFGPDWLPGLNRYPQHFKTELNLLKQALYHSGRHLFVDLRKEYAFHTGIWQYYIKTYVEKFYPDVKLAGSIPGFEFLRYYHMFNVPYMSKYALSYQYMARMNRDQPLALSADKFSLFNRNISMPYKMALGWEFTGQYAGKKKLDSVLSQYLHRGRIHFVSLDTFQNLWAKAGGKDIDFIWKDFYRTRKKIDFTRKKVKRSADSVTLLLINRTQYEIPINITVCDNGKKSDSARYYFFKKTKLLTLPLRKNNTVYLNRHVAYPEINLRNNTFPPAHKPLVIRFFKDLENPWSRQIFVNPSLNYNYYDGVILGAGINNMTFLDKNFQFEIIPEYAFKSQTYTGKIKFKYFKHFTRKRLFGYTFGGYANRYHYAPQFFYHNASFFTKISYRDPAQHFNAGSDITAEYTYVNKEAAIRNETTQYGIFFLGYKHFSKGLIKNHTWDNRLEFHPAFFKIISEFKFRTFLDKFRQVEYRIFAGWMPVNRTRTDYFSFALSRPTDYLFKYHYYGRSETSGIFYQQYIYAEGAFKVFYDDQFANEALIAQNINIGLYKRLNFFVDLAWAKNKGKPFRFHYDGGIRYYLVPDYFEFYFPLFSDQGFIPIDRNYLSKIRIMFVFDLPRLFKLLSRSWY